MRGKALLVSFALMLMLSSSCSRNAKNIEPSSGLPAGLNVHLFVSLPPESTGVYFTNHVMVNDYINYLSFPYVYNGGGVAAGDFNNDGLTDLFFSSNEYPDQLFINRGKMKFYDITRSAGVMGKQGWTTGVSVVDINNDGLLDIYVCYAGGYTDPAFRANQLFINNGDLTFTERAKEYGLDDKGCSTQAYFFDYDNDGDLDVFVVNHPLDFENSNALDERPWQPRAENDHDSDRLYRNNGNNTFTNVTKKAGISDHAWGLAAVIHDFNNDGWKDIFITSDFRAPDLLWVNNRNGTFSMNLKEHIRHTSFNAKGADLADIDNDGLADLFVAAMSPADRAAFIKMTPSVSTEEFFGMVKRGYHYQYHYNTLQLNNGHGSFSEIAFLSGVESTEWSWAPLFADFDNDGFKDLFVTNGVNRGVTDNDWKLNLERMLKEGKTLKYNEVEHLLPRTISRNYIFRNNGDLTFLNVSRQWNMTDSINSTAAVYADLDNDGDLDLVVNNFDTPASIYENKQNEVFGNHYLRVRLLGPKNNLMAYGAVVKIFTPQGMQMQEVQPVRGFQSSVETDLHFGIGKDTVVDRLLVEWPDGTLQELLNLASNQIVGLSYYDEKSRIEKSAEKKEEKIFLEDKTSGIAHVHRENEYNDFEKEKLLPHKNSEFGPFISSGDVNGDGWEDFFIGGSAGYSGTMYLQSSSGKFFKSPSQPWEKERDSEDMASRLFDADNDGDLDLYVVSGGNEFPPDSPLLQDRLYKNDGRGNFHHAPDALPRMLSSGMRLAAGDYDKDGDTDLFVGGRLIPGQYPLTPRSYLLRNDAGRFTDVTGQHDELLSFPGMVTGACFADYDGDKDLDLIIVGEWMPVTLFNNDNGRFLVADNTGLNQTSGWWRCIAPDDVDSDGDIDFIAGNLGLNSRFSAGRNVTLHIYSSDIDGSGTREAVLAKNNGQGFFPVFGYDRLSEQMPFIRQKFPTCQSFAEASIEEIFTPEALKKSLHKEAADFRTSIILNNGDGTFSLKPLPNLAQIAPVNDIIVKDVSGDGSNDLILAGNFFGTEPETPRYDAGNGLMMQGDGKGNFFPLTVYQSGLVANGNVSDLELLTIGKTGYELLVVGNNDAALQAFRVNSSWNKEKFISGK